jgi:hypothetical protein
MGWMSEDENPEQGHELERAGRRLRAWLSGIRPERPPSLPGPRGGRAALAQPGEDCRKRGSRQPRRHGEGGRQDGRWLDGATSPIGRPASRSVAGDPDRWRPRSLSGWSSRRYRDGTSTRPRSTA